MKKKIVVVFLSFISLTIQAQFALYCKMVLPVLELKDEQLLTQFDSILFVKYPCFASSYGKKEQYVYFVNIKEDTLNNYIISIVYAKPSVVNNEINTGIYKMNEKGTLIIRENSQRPLFAKTGEKENFVYKMELMMSGGNGFELREMISPEEFCTWVLSYSENNLEVIEPKPATKIPLPPLDQKLEWRFFPSFP